MTRATDLQISDDDLLRRIAANDEAAFRILVSRHVDQAFGLALRILRNRHDAEDAVQDSLLNVWTHRHRWEFGRAKFSTFLCRIVINRCIDLRRRRRPEIVEGIAEVPDRRADPAAALDRSETSHLLESAISQLPERQRLAVLLSYHENLSNDEIADVMETTVFAIESLLKRARVQLREVLRGHEHDIRVSLAAE